MKRWAVLTVLLYALALLLLTAPVLLIAFGGWAKNGHGIKLLTTLKTYLHWSYWLWLAVLVAGQALLLLLPINLAERRLPARRPVKIPVIVTGFFLASLLFAGLLAVLCAAFKEEGFGIFGFLTPFKANEVSPSDLQTLVGMIITILVFWFIWAAIFQKSAKSGRPGCAAQTQHALAPARQHSRTPHRRAQPCLRAPPRRLLRARRHVLGHCHRHFRHAPLLRTGRVLPVRRTVRAVEAETAGQKFERDIQSQRLNETGCKQRQLLTVRPLDPLLYYAIDFRR